MKMWASASGILSRSQKTVKDILDTLLNDYDVEPKCCERDLLAVLQEMADEGLIEIKNETIR